MFDRDSGLKRAEIIVFSPLSKQVPEGDEAADSVGPGVFLDRFDGDEGDKVFFYRADRYAIYL